MDRNRKVAARRIAVASIAVSALLAAGTAVALASPGAILVAHLRVNPSSGPAGTMVVLQGKGFFPDAQVNLSFTDANGTIDLGVVQAGAGGRFKERYCIPSNASTGADLIAGLQQVRHDSAWGQTTFTVTGSPTAWTTGMAANRSVAAPLSTCV